MARITTHPTDKEIDEIASQRAFADHDAVRKVLNAIEGTPEDATDPVVMIYASDRDRLCAAARDRNRLEAEIAKLREALKNARVELAALVRNPDGPSMPDDWPVQTNLADRACLNSAFAYLSELETDNG